MPGFGSLAQTPDEPYPEEGAGMPETYQSPAGKAMANLGIGLAKAIWDIPRKLGQAAEVPAGLRREDVTDLPVRHGITGTNQFGSEPQDELVEGTTGSAINRIGTGLPFAPRGAGAFGGKLVKPVEAMQSEVPHQSPYEGWHEAMEGIKAYHGSPHDFDRFDTSRIGTGEGAQAYGHGLYFAENEGVAKSYRDTLAGAKDSIVNKEIQSHGGLDAAIKHNQDTINAFNLIPQEVRQKNALLRDQEATARERLDALKAFEKSGDTTGKMYEVNIKADPEHFLDWDKPLSEQPQAVKDALSKSKIWGNMDESAVHEAINNSLIGTDWLAKKTKSPETASALREAGIPGIKYLDQGSRTPPVQILSPNDTVHGQWLVKQMPNGQVYYRGADEAAARAAYESAPKPTHNYVVFDDKLIDILRKYGWAGLVGSAGLLGGKDPSKEM